MSHRDFVGILGIIVGIVIFAICIFIPRPYNDLLIVLGAGILGIGVGAIL